MEINRHLSDSLIYALEVSNKLQLDKISEKLNHLDTPDWYKFIIPAASLLATLAASYFAYRIALVTFKNNRSFELEKIAANKLKEKNDTLRKLYGEFVGNCEIYINSLNMMNYHNIQQKYYSFRSLNAAEQAIKSEYQLKERLAHESYLKVTDKVIEMQYKLNSILAEYFIINPDTTAYLQYRRINTNKYHYKFEENFENDKTEKDSEKHLQFLIDTASEQIEEHVGTHTQATINQFQKEILAQSN